MALEQESEKGSGKNGQSEKTKSDETVEKQPLVITLEILPTIKEAQQQHGLRHGDYQRYRQYCARRLRRLYKSLHFTHGRQHYKPKKLTKNMLTDERYLLIPLMNTERAWAYAMELKLLANTEPRKRFHLIRRLRKAVSSAQELLELCDADVCDARTKLEAQAYSSFMRASLKFELQEWQQALDLFSSAKTIYEKLASAFLDEQRSMYLQRAEDVTPNIRYCAYNLDDGTMDINDLAQLRLSTAGSDMQDMLADKLNAVLAQTREKQAAGLNEVTWRNKTVPIKNEQVRAFILHCQESEQELERAESVENKLSVYENLLMECKDSLQALRDDAKAEAAKTRSQKTEAQLLNMQFLQTYLSYLRHVKTIERNLLMTEPLKASLPGTLQEKCVLVKESQLESGRKTSKPDDLIRLYDLILQNLTDITELDGIEDDLVLSKELAAQMIGYKAYRCFYVAHSYLLAHKWPEAIALYERVLNHVISAIAHYQDCSNIHLQREIPRLEELGAKTRGHRCSTLASCLLDNKSLDENSTKVASSDKPLSSRLDEYFMDPSLSTKKAQVTAFPPEFQPTPCKPLFFDLAFNHIEFPSLEQKVETKKAAGLTGYLKGWLWGGNS